jgi:hypothetical protein
MNRHAVFFLLLAGIVAGMITAACAQDGHDDARLTVATWNSEWLMLPETFDALAGSCLKKGERAGGDERTIYCNMVPGNRWSNADLERLGKFAATIPADVFAMQETDGPGVAARVCPAGPSALPAASTCRT